MKYLEEYALPFLAMLTIVSVCAMLAVTHSNDCSMKIEMLKIEQAGNLERMKLESTLVSQAN